MDDRGSAACSIPTTAPAEAPYRERETEAPAASATQPTRRARALLWLSLPLALWLAWEAVAWGVAGWLISGEADGRRIHQALNWAPQHPQALFLAAQSDLERAPEEARGHLLALLRQHPGHAWGWLLLAELESDGGDPARAGAFLQTAAAFAPWDGALHQRAGDLWLKLGRLEAAVQAWDRAMVAAPATRRVLYPRLLRLLEYLQQTDFLEPVVRREPPWWPAFFREAVQPPTSLDLVRALYALGGAQGEARAEMRRAYLQRLIDEGLWQEAYLAWLNALDGRARRHLGLIFNGGFELPLGQMGFSWRTTAPQRVKVERRRTYGIGGDRALFLQYKGKAVPDGHLAQYLLLPPGRYRLHYRARPDSLRAAEGLRLAIHCLGPDGAPLGYGQRLLGVYQWRTDVLEWTVPASGCPAQELRLEVVKERQRDARVKGVLWLDDFRLRPVSR